MVAKPNDLADAVTYRIGTFPPSALDYEVLLGPLEGKRRLQPIDLRYS
jgi:hypothetical protein